MRAWAAGSVQPPIVAVAVLGVGAQHVVVGRRLADPDLGTVLAAEDTVWQPRALRRMHTLGLPRLWWRPRRRMVIHPKLGGEGDEAIDGHGVCALARDVLQPTDEVFELREPLLSGCRIDSPRLAIGQSLQLLKCGITLREQRILLLLACHHSFCRLGVLLLRTVKHSLRFLSEPINVDLTACGR